MSSKTGFSFDGATITKKEQKKILSPSTGLKYGLQFNTALKCGENSQPA